MYLLSVNTVDKVNLGWKEPPLVPTSPSFTLEGRTQWTQQLKLEGRLYAPGDNGLNNPFPRLLYMKLLQ